MGGRDRDAASSEDEDGLTGLERRPWVAEKAVPGGYVLRVKEGKGGGEHAVWEGQREGRERGGGERAVSRLERSAFLREDESSTYGYDVGARLDVVEVLGDEDESRLRKRALSALILPHGWKRRPFHLIAHEILPQHAIKPAS